MSVPTQFSLFKRNNGYYRDGRKRWKSTKCRRKSETLKALTEIRTFPHG